MDKDPAAQADVRDEMRAAPAPTSAGDPPPLGVLFVHGLGNAQRGETLAGAGEPLVNWLRYWIRGGIDYSVPGCDDGDICLTSTYLSKPNPDPNDRDAPACAILDYTAGIDGEPAAHHRWILAECWWADDFPQAKFANLWNWALAVAPWLLARTATNIINQIQRVVDQIDHMVGQAMAARMRNAEPAMRNSGRAGDNSHSERPIPRSGNPVRSLLLGAARATMSFFLLAGQALMTTSLFLIILLGGVLAELLIFALVVLSFLPPVRSLVVGIQQGLASDFGDGYMIAASPLSLEAMITQVQHDIKWLKRADNCGEDGPIAVVAHSGGTAVSYHALLDHQTAPVQLLVTYGNGLSKLEAIRDALGNRGWRFAFSAVVRLLAVLALLTALVPVFIVDTPPWLLIVVAFAASILCEYISQRLYGKLSNVAENNGPTLSSPKAYRWMDFYSAADPAPDGPLPRPEGMPPEAFSSTLVTNLHSVTKDHGQYWFNNEQFLSRVTRALSEIAGSGSLIPPDHEQAPPREEMRSPSGELEGAQAILVASAKRRIRTFLYMVTGLLAFLELPLLWISWGQWVYTAGTWLSNPILGIQTSSSSLADQSGEKLPDKLAFFVAALIGMLLVAIVVVAYENLVLFTFWREWSAVDTDAMFARKLDRSNVWLILVFLGASMAVPALVVVSVLTGFAAPQAPGGQGDGVASVWLAMLKWLLGAGDDRALGEVATILSTVTWALAWMGLLVSVAIALVGAYLCSLGPRFLADWEQRYGQTEDKDAIKEMMIRTRLGKRLEQMATGRTIAWLVVLVALFYLVFFLLSSQLAQHVTAHNLQGYQPLEYPTFDFPAPQKTFETITDFDSEGRALYIWSCSTLDTIFPLLYGLLMVLIILWSGNKVTGGKRPAYITLVAILPIVMVALDYLENASILTMLTHYPREIIILEQGLPILTDAKWAMLPITATALLVAVIIWWLRDRRHKDPGA